jgi:hypothetical protein
MASIPLLISVVSLLLSVTEERDNPKNPEEFLVSG